MTNESTAPVAMHFAAQALDPETFKVIAFNGEEEISRPYRFEIDLAADNPDIDMDTLLFSRASLSLEKGDRERRIHGVVAECDLLDAMPDERFHYRVVLVPRLWLLSLSRQNQIYQDLSVPDIVSQEIVASRAKGITKDAASGLAGDDFEMRLTRTYARREYMVQFRESDLDFISRLMEHEGIFYYFEQLEDREKVVVSDNNVHFAALEEDDTLAYRPASGMARAEDEAVLSFAMKNRRVPRKMVIKDYNYRMPHLTLQGEALIDEKAHGICSDYGDHFKTPEEGDEMARIRAQELLCGKSTCRGHADSIRLWPGWRFTLDEHFRESFNTAYIVTAIRHSGRQPLESTAGIDGTQPDAAAYDTQFTCIPSDVDYRPPRRTPKPVIQGLMNAQVDAALLEKRAEIDEQGRYKLVMPFDLSGAAAGKASRFVRKAQPYGGHDMGMHFPLYKGTEVICGFVNGDPDRPIITGVVPNPLTASVVTSDNYTKNVVKTGHGSYLEFNDGKGPADRAVEESSNDSGLAAQQQHQSTGPAFEGLPVSGARPAATAETGAGGRRGVELARQQHRQNLSSAQESAPGSSADVWFRVDVPNYNNKTAQDEQKSAYLRMGERPPDERYTMDAKSEEKKETYAVETSDQTVSISCKEGNRYIVSPDPGTGINAPGYSISSCMSGMSFDPATGVITFNVGFGAFEANPSPQTTLTITYTDSSDQTQSTETAITWNIEDVSGKAPIPDGWFNFTDSDHTTVIGGNKEEKILKEEGWFNFAAYETVQKVEGVTRKVSLEHTSSFSAAFGDEESYFAGSKIEGFLGLKNEIALASALEIFTGIKYESHLDWNFQFGSSGTVNFINGDEFSVVDEKETYATGIKLHVLETDKTGPLLNWVNGITQVVGTGVVGAWTGGRSAMHKLDDEGWQIAGAAEDWSTHGLFAAGQIVLLIVSIIAANRIKRYKKTNEGITQLNMEKDKLELKCGKPPIVGVEFASEVNMDKDKIELKCGKSEMVLHKNGYIYLKGENVILMPRQTVGMKPGKSVNIHSCDKVLIQPNQLVTILNEVLR